MAASCGAASSPHPAPPRGAVELAREGVPPIIQRQFANSSLDTTSIYLQGIDRAEIIGTVHARRTPMVPVTPTLHP